MEQLKIGAWARWDTYTRKWVAILSDIPEMEKVGWVKIADHEVWVELPPQHELDAAYVLYLKEEKVKVRAEATAKVTKLDEEIQSFLALEAPNEA